MANEELSRSGDALRKRLDEQEVLLFTVQQLRKDLDEPDLALPRVGNEAFEQLRAEVKARLELWQRSGSTSMARAINRVDLTEAQVNRSLEAGGLHELAGAMVLRSLQKVLLRERYAGRF